MISDIRNFTLAQRYSMRMANTMQQTQTQAQTGCDETRTPLKSYENQQQPGVVVDQQMDATQDAANAPIVAGTVQEFAIKAAAAVALQQQQQQQQEHASTDMSNTSTLDDGKVDAAIASSTMTDIGAGDDDVAELPLDLSDEANRSASSGSGRHSRKQHTPRQRQPVVDSYQRTGNDSKKLDDNVSGRQLAADFALDLQRRLQAAIQQAVIDRFGEGRLNGGSMKHHAQTQTELDAHLQQQQQQKNEVVNGGQDGRSVDGGMHLFSMLQDQSDVGKRQAQQSMTQQHQAQQHQSQLPNPNMPGGTNVLQQLHTIKNFLAQNKQMPPDAIAKLFGPGTSARVPHGQTNGFPTAAEMMTKSSTPPSFSTPNPGMFSSPSTAYSHGAMNGSMNGNGAPRPQQPPPQSMSQRCSYSPAPQFNGGQGGPLQGGASFQPAAGQMLQKFIVEFCQRQRSGNGASNAQLQALMQLANSGSLPTGQNSMNGDNKAKLEDAMNMGMGFAQPGAKRKSAQMLGAGEFDKTSAAPTSTAMKPLPMALTMSQQQQQQQQQSSTSKVCRDTRSYNHADNFVIRPANATDPVAKRRRPNSTVGGRSDGELPVDLSVAGRERQEGDTTIDDGDDEVVDSPFSGQGDGGDDIESLPDDGEDPFMPIVAENNEVHVVVSDNREIILSQTSSLTPMHLRKAKLMFFYTRYPNSQLLKQLFPDVHFNKSNIAQLVKWFSNFREFYYHQVDKYARQLLSEGITSPDQILITRDMELFRTINQHYNRNNQLQVEDTFLAVVQRTVQEFHKAIASGRDLETGWKKPIYKVIAQFDEALPEYFQSIKWMKTLAKD